MLTTRRMKTIDALLDGQAVTRGNWRTLLPNLLYMILLLGFLGLYLRDFFTILK